MAAGAKTSAEYLRLARIVRDGTPEELRQALPSDKKKRKAAVCVLDKGRGLSLLFDACSWERWDMAAALVQEHGHPVDLPFPRFEGSTALHQMCFHGRTKAALFLIRTLGANPRALAKNDWTVLQYACQNGHTELARILVRDFRLDANAVTHNAETPLYSASVRGHTGTALSLINDLGARVDATDTIGSTPLMQAAGFGQTGTTLALINLGGARIDAADKNGSTPLHYACA
jgi:ankyrin repeat protein